MSNVWMGIAARARQARVIALSGPGETILKARFPAPRHPRAVATLLEAVALWHGRKVRAALAVDDPLDSFDTSTYPDCLHDGFDSPLYELEWVQAVRRRGRRRDELGGMGYFCDLRRLVMREVPR